MKWPLRLLKHLRRLGWLKGQKKFRKPPTHPSLQILLGPSRQLLSGIYRIWFSVNYSPTGLPLILNYYVFPLLLHAPYSLQAFDALLHRGILFISRDVISSTGSPPGVRVLCCLELVLIGSFLKNRFFILFF